MKSGNRQDSGMVLKFLFLYPVVCRMHFIDWKKGSILLNR